MTCQLFPLGEFAVQLPANLLNRVRASALVVDTVRTPYGQYGIPELHNTRVEIPLEWGQEFDRVLA